jgi:hypothetical protein
MLKLKDKPDELKALQAANDEYNKNIQEVVKALWNLNKDIVYLSELEAKKIIDLKDDKYCFLEQGYFSGRGSSQNGMSYMYVVPVLQIRSAVHPNSALIVTSLPEWHLGKGALTYCVQQLCFCWCSSPTNTRPGSINNKQ